MEVTTVKRIFLIVLDSCGAGAMPDAAQFGDVGVHTPVSYTQLTLPTNREV